MGCNPEEGSIRMLDDVFNKEEAARQGFTEVFVIGEMIKIKNCFFEVNNFVEELGFMNLKLLTNEEALIRMADLLPQGEILEPIKQMKEGSSG